MTQAQFPAESGDGGQFKRQPDAFKGWPGAAEAGRYHLYVSYACPWAHRTIIARALMGLEDAIGMTVVDPIRDARGWAFTDADPDPVNGFRFLSAAYLASNPGFHGRYTVPVLWDKHERRILSNDDDDILRMLGTTFAPVAKHDADLYPAAHREAIDALSAWIYPRVNDGVYRAGFATTQGAYAHAVETLFDALDELERRLDGRDFLIADHPVETDWRLFVTLVRFDAVYVGHFKCNVRRIADYPNLQAFLTRLYRWPGVAATVDLDHIKRHYYVTHRELNPTGIVPTGPALEFLRA